MDTMCTGHSFTEELRLYSLSEGLLGLGAMTKRV